MTTVRAYRQELAKFVAYLSTLVDVRSPDMLEALDRGVLRRYQVQLADVLPNPRSRSRSLVALRSFLNYAYDEGWTSTLLSRQIVLPSFVMGDPHPIRTEDVPRLLAGLPRANLRDLRDRALVFFPASVVWTGPTSRTSSIGCVPWLGSSVKRGSLIGMTIGWSRAMSAGTSGATAPHTASVLSSSGLSSPS